MPITYLANDIIQDALIEINMLAPGETADGETASWAFRKLNYLLDTWATRRNYVYTTTIDTYTLIPALNPHTIGPTGTFVVPQRPTKIVNATIILNNVNPPVEIPLTLRDDAWYMNDVTIKGLTSQQPTDLYYSPTYPNGSLYFWPVPTIAYGTRLELWTLLSQFDTILDPIDGPTGVGSLAPGYRNALMLSLAETLLPGGAKSTHPMLAAAAANARASVFNLNSPSPRMDTRDSGVPGADDDIRQSNFNYRSRSWF